MKLFPLNEGREEFFLLFFENQSVSAKGKNKKVQFTYVVSGHRVPIWTICDICLKQATII